MQLTPYIESQKVMRFQQTVSFSKSLILLLVVVKTLWFVYFTNKPTLKNIHKRKCNK